MKVLRLVMLVLALSLTTMPSARAESALGYVQIKSLEFANASGDLNNITDDDWRAVTLPDRWTDDRRWEVSRIGWYRIDLNPVLEQLREADASEPFAIYLQRLSTNARVYLNNEFVGSGGQFEEPVARNMHRPLLFTLPSSALRPSGNVMHIELITYPHFSHLIGVRIGEYEAVRPMYERQYFIQVSMSQILFVVALMASLFGFAFWFFVERTQANLFFSLTALSWSIYCLNLCVRDIPIPAEIWWPMIHTNLEWAACFLVIFAHRLCEISSPRFEGVVITLACVATAVYAVAGIEHINAVSRAFHMVTMLVAIYLLFTLIKQFVRTRKLESGLLSACIMALIILGANDLTRHTVPVDSPDWQTPFYVLQFGAPMMFIVIAVFVSSRYARALRHSSHLQSTQHKARLAERERIYQDLHDDVGAKLLGLVYAAKTNEERALARDALSDIREIVSHTPQESMATDSFVEQLIAEARSRCTEANIVANLSSGDLPAETMSGESAYHTMRVVRELITNTIKHSGAKNIWMDIQADYNRMSIEYRDDGVGLPDVVPVHSGLPGIQKRIHRLEADFEMLGDKGFHTLMSIPLEAEGLPKA